MREREREKTLNHIRQRQQWQVKETDVHADVMVMDNKRNEKKHVKHTINEMIHKHAKQAACKRERE